MNTRRPAHARRTGPGVVAAVPILACTAWALWPLGDGGATVPAPAPNGHDAQPESGPVRTLALDQAAFRSPIWIAPPPPPPPPPVAKAAPPPPPPPPLKLQLVAIIQEGSSHAAVCYDPESDRMVTIRDGERDAAGRARPGPARVTATSLTLGEGSRAATLTLAKPTQGGEAAR